MFTSQHHTFALIVSQIPTMLAAAPTTSIHDRFIAIIQYRKPVGNSFVTMLDNLQELTGGKVTQTVAFQQQKNQLYGVRFLFAKF
jgi:hypothetical protein